MEQTEPAPIVGAQDAYSALARATLNNVTISVSDIARMIAWYERVLAFRCVRRGQFAAVGAEFAFLQRPGLSLELVRVPSAHRLAAIDVDPPHHLGPTGFKALVFDVDDLVAVTAELKAQGVQIVWESQLLDSATGLKSTLVRDCEGNLINFFQLLPR